MLSTRSKANRSLPSHEQANLFRTQEQANLECYISIKRNTKIHNQNEGREGVTEQRSRGLGPLPLQEPHIAHLNLHI